jgi:sugar phosphate isomerase/epimerase
MPVRIAAFPKCYEYQIGMHRTMSVFDWIAMACGRLDVDGLEMYDRFFESLDPAYLRSVARAVADAGLVIPMLIASPDFTHPDPRERSRAVAYEARMIEVAALLGGPGTICRILSGQQRPEVSRAQGIAWVLEAIEQLIPVAHAHDVVLGMENHYKDSQWPHPEFALKMDVFLEIVSSVSERRYFGVQYDPSNAIVAGDDPLALLEAIKDRVVSMHASDRYLKAGSTLEDMRVSDGQLGYAPHLAHGVIGQGLNDYPAILQTLAREGYSGWISIEDGLNGLDEIAESARYLRGLCARYFPAPPKE